MSDFSPTSQVQNVNATTTSQSVTMGFAQGQYDVEFTNLGTVPVFFLYAATVTATNGIPIQPGASKVYGIPGNAQAISYITATGTANLIMIAGSTDS